MFNIDYNVNLFSKKTYTEKQHQKCYGKNEKELFLSGFYVKKKKKKLLLECKFLMCIKIIII